MAHINEGEPPPKELILVWDMERWSTLPESGGLLNQDAYVMHISSALQSIYKALSRLKNMKGDQIHDLSESERKIIGNLKRNGYM